MRSASFRGRLPRFVLQCPLSSLSNGLLFDSLMLCASSHFEMNSLHNQKKHDSYRLYAQNISMLRLKRKCSTVQHCTELSKIQYIHPHDRTVTVLQTPPQSKKYHTMSAMLITLTQRPSSSIHTTLVTRRDIIVPSTSLIKSRPVQVHRR